jgi:hypothetical protein|uniref:Uncharacterized protein n=1 Tax=viral metagenome TaxID=1070528 RepID=A0A6C0BF00_9ZZZZ
MSDIKHLTSLYDVLKTPCKLISQDKIVFVELFKGTGSMSSYIHHFPAIKHVITLDNHADFEPTFHMDILEANEGSVFITKMDELVRDGYFIIMHVTRFHV